MYIMMPAKRFVNSCFRHFTEFGLHPACRQRLSSGHVKTTAAATEYRSAAVSLTQARPTLPTTSIFCMTYFFTSSIPGIPYFFGS